MVSILNMLGRNASHLMAIGCVLAVFMPPQAQVLLPLLPILIVLMLTLAIARIDLVSLWQQMTLRRLVLISGFCILSMGLSPVLFFYGGQFFGASEALLKVMVYFGVSPPMATCIAFALLLGVDSLFALEVVIIGSVLAPFIGPLMINILLGDGIGVSSVDLFIRLTSLVAFCLLAGFIYRKWVGEQKLNAHSVAYDGAFVFMTVLFVLPLFSGFIDIVWSDPWFALKIAIAVYAITLGMQFVTFHIQETITRSRAISSSGAILWGNRNLAIYFAIIPIEPVFVLFMAFYQFSILFTPLVFGRMYRGH